jgi:RNA polymerase sigma-70 factor (ECF subfamily)
MNLGGNFDRRAGHIRGVQADCQPVEEIYRRHGAAVYAYALRRADAQTAQDVLSEVFLVAVRRADQLPEEPLPWLFGVARRVLANTRRGSARQQALVERLGREPTPIGETADSDVLQALAKLRDADREALLLVAWEGLSNPEAATVLDVRPATFAVRLHRAKRRLRHELDHLDYRPERGDAATTPNPEVT